jgi:shikimate dehydrogenase
VIAPVRRFAVLGNPVAHSKSPAMHAAAYRALNLPHVYTAIRVTPDELAEKVHELRCGAYDGFNVTVPHKQRVLEHVDDVDVSARVAGAANTLVRVPSGRIVAHNTDAPALAEEMRALAPELTQAAWRGATAIVIGAGGAARSAIVALGIGLAVARIVVRARDREGRSEAFAAEMLDLLAGAGSRARFDVAPLCASPEIERTASVVVQATSAGMTGADSGDAVADAICWAELAPRAIALDVVYAPLDTPFLRAARQHGIRSANGIGMLARQGALAFQLWLGGKLPYNAMLTALI